MKKRLLATLLCATLLISSGATGAFAESATQATDSLFYTTMYGTSDGKTLSELTALDDEQVASYNDDRTFTLTSSAALPCQVFEVDTSGVTASDLDIAVGVATTANERAALKVYNTASSQWDTVATVVTEGQLTATVPLKDHTTDNRMQVMVTVDFVANGSNRLLWSTDQQHYAEHADLNKFYSQIHEYMVEEYQKDNVCYVINTGDIVDDTPSYSTAPLQWRVASDAFEILDEAGVPYGIVTGNHDVGDYPTNLYDLYLSKFPAERYESNPWYGGTPDNNRCHYDLVTVGNYDFLFLYIGYGLGDDETVINWANDVLAMYPHRNAVICTHQYLKPTSLTQEGRAEIIHNAIVTQNPNVKMILSGHYDGAGYKWRDTDDESGRQVLEVISDYQFVQVESEEYYADHEDPLHHIGSVAYCNGEGYIREIVIEGNTIDMYAFSPITGGVTPFGARDDVSFTVDLQATERTITTYGFKAAASTDETTLTVPDDAAEGFTVSWDVPSFEALLDRANAVNKKDYTKDSYNAFKDVLKSAKSTYKSSTDVSDAYFELSNALAALEEKTDAMDPDNLETVLDFNLQLPMWQNTSGPSSLDKVRSWVKADQLDNGGFTIKKSDFSGNAWPAVKYVEPITFTPKDGKVYLYLDVEAGSTWSIFPTVIQDMQQYQGRLNYIIEGSYRNDMDAGCGTYVGVYDVTQALIDMGVDPTKEMTISFTMNVVPGPVTVNKITLLTGEYSDPFTFGDFWQMIVDFFANLFGF